MTPTAHVHVSPTLAAEYDDVYTPDALAAIEALCAFVPRHRALVRARTARRAARFRDREPISFLPEDGLIPGTAIRVADARAGRFVGSEIPHDLRRQWLQGTGPATRPGAPLEVSLRSVAYALLSGADGWMFDGEDALGQASTMSLDNIRNLVAANGRAEVFLAVAERVAGEMNAWARGFFGRDIVTDWRAQLDAPTVIYRCRGLHLDDRHLQLSSGGAVPASIADLALYVVNNHALLRERGRSVVIYLPKIQTAAEAAHWNALLTALEQHEGLEVGTIKAYVLVEQLEATFQLMEIRAALAPHFVGFNTGRWDYIHSVADAFAWDPAFVHPNIEAIGMTYGYMRAYEDRVRRAAATPDLAGRCALWQGGMEPNIPVGSPDGVAAGMARAVEGARREAAAGASGKWIAHWKMAHIVRPVWEEIGEDNQLGRSFPPLTYTADDAADLRRLEPAERTLSGARNLLSVALQYGNAFLQGSAAAALKPADAFGDDDVLYLMEDMATCEIRVSILWEWVHKRAALDDGTTFTPDRFEQLLDEETAKLLAADDRDVWPRSKQTTLPIARQVVASMVRDPAKLPWTIDLLNLNLDHADLDAATSRIGSFRAAFAARGERITHNPAHEPPPDAEQPRVRRTGRRGAGLVRSAPVRRHPAPVHARPGGRATRHHRGRLPRRAGRGRGLRRAAARAVRPAPVDHDVRAVHAGPGGGDEARGHRGDLPRGPGRPPPRDRRGRIRGRISRATRSLRSPTRRRRSVRALLAADKNQRFARARMTPEQRACTPATDFRPFVIADADTGHGGDAHVRNLVRRFVEVGVVGYQHRGPEARGRRSAATRAARSSCRSTSRSSGSTPPASSST